MSIKLGLMVLRELGEKLDFSPNAITGGGRVDVCQEGCQDNGTLTLSLMQDPAKSAAVSVLSLLLLSSFVSRQNYINLSATIILCICRFSCNYGPSVHTPFVIAGLTYTMVNVGDLCGCSR